MEAGFVLMRVTGISVRSRSRARISRLFWMY